MPATLYFSRPVFTWDLDWSTSPVQRLDYDIQEVGCGLKETLLWGDQTHVIRGWTAEVPLDSGEAISEFDAWTAALRGRLVGFWLPAPEQAFRIIAATSPTQFDIEAAGLAATFEDGPELHLWFTKAGEAPVAVKVSSVADLGEGLERVTVSPGLGVTPDATWYVRPLLYVRLADDTERAQFIAENRQVRSLKVIELPLEYAAAETGQSPVYLYRFWIDTDPVTEWRLTGFAWDLEIAGQVWTAKRITHGQIQRSTRADMPDFTIECERDPVIPVIHLVPPALSLPLNVEVRESLSLADAGNVIAIGRVQSVRASGRSFVAKCASFSEVLPRSLPGFLLQARCNWQVFSGPCGASQAGYAKTAEVTAVSGRSVVVTDTSLSGLGAAWFAEGWIEVGAGVNREVRTVMASSAAAGNAVTLTVSYPFHRAQTGNAATVLPGCDGKADTCASKFVNFINWGGHRGVSRNITLKGLRTPDIGGGKK
jgi:hypothetical protein